MTDAPVVPLKEKVPDTVLLIDEVGHEAATKFMVARNPVATTELSVEKAT